MSIEASIGQFFPEISEFIVANYPTPNEAKVDALIAQTKSETEEHRKRNAAIGFDYDPLQHLRVDATYMAQDSGVSENLLTTLSAIQKWEADLPDAERELTPKKYIELLISAEATSVRNSASPWVKIDAGDVGTHVGKVQKLLEFLKDFE
jgi:hypothetical protein